MILTLNSGQSSALAYQYVKQQCAPGKLIAVMVRILAVIALPTAIGLALVGWLVPHQQSLIPVAIVLPFALFSQSATGLFLADSNVRNVWTQQSFPIVIAALVYIPLLIFAHAGIWVLFAVWAGSYAAGAVYTAFALRPYARRTEGNNPSLRQQLSWAAQISLNAVVAFLNFRIDVFIIMFMLGQSALGVYSIGIGLGELLWQLTQPIATASFGRIARGSEAEAADLTATCMRHSFMLVFIGAIVLFFVAPPLIPMVYGKSFAASGTVTRLLLPGIIAYSVMPVLARFYTQQLGNPRIPLTFSSLSMVLCAITTVLLLPHFGIAGGAVATSVSYMTAFTASAIYFVRRTGIRPQRLFKFTRGDLVPYRSVVMRVFPIGR
jgi:O-antigen/teichoic acid export membrane protein